jgi:hypothetical protein
MKLTSVIKQRTAVVHLEKKIKGCKELVEDHTTLEALEEEETIIFDKNLYNNMKEHTGVNESCLQNTKADGR